MKVDVGFRVVVAPGWRATHLGRAGDVRSVEGGEGSWGGRAPADSAAGVVVDLHLFICVQFKAQELIPLYSTSLAAHVLVRLSRRMAYIHTGLPPPV